MQHPRLVRALVAVAAAGVVAIALVATGALGARDDAPVPEIGLGEPLSTSRADVVVLGIEPGEEGGIAVTLAVESHLPVSLQIDDLLTLVDDQGELARFGHTTVGDVAASAAQPGVEDVFTILYEPERAADGRVRVELVDATWTPRDETAFGLGSNMYDERVVATVAMP
ncbi:hypothetical protein [Agrococcus sp. SGAir0287]|uniref:hypothetical protein n=1 Tax=Agrococcus sp. SGAir0287 TaxID=2070347 RepID=UPI00158614DC|nr:hypothetical protein [Agrococcus sp. SGAir0287]